MVDKILLTSDRHQFGHEQKAWLATARKEVIA